MLGFIWRLFFPKPKPEMELFLRVCAVEFDKTEPDDLSKGFIWLIEPAAPEHQTRAAAQRLLYEKIGDYFSAHYPNESRSVVMEWKDGKPFVRCGHVFFHSYGAAMELSELEQIVMLMMNRYGTLVGKRWINKPTAF